ncbi:MAG: flagellin, partial [Rhodocyclaceae bacterium]
FLKDLDQALQNNDKNRANIGATLQEVDYLRETSSDKILQYTGSISKLIDLDYAEAISRMMLQQTSLQAAISAFQQTTQLSLFK